MNRIAQILISGGALPALTLLSACATAPVSSVVEPPAATEIGERWLTERDERDDVDSLAVWSDGEDRHWLLGTSKANHVLIVYDAATGERLDTVGGAGDAPGRFLRPNGISVLDDLVWVVERDNRRVQVLTLPDFEPVTTFGEDELSKPYGLWVTTTGHGYRVFVTDAYETPDEQIPPDDQLDRRLHRFEVRRNGGRLAAAHAGFFGPTAGDGRLAKVESLYGDAGRGRLLVADEHETRLDIKIFDLEGGYTGERIAEGILQYEPEGIALYACGDGGGVWLVTDQDHRDNRFLLFDRQTFDPLGAFTGAVTANTDGVWLHAGALPGFPHGVFYAVHDDGGAAAFDLSDILALAGREPCG